MTIPCPCFSHLRSLPVLALLLSLCVLPAASAQAPAAVKYDSGAISGLTARNIGSATMGGRVAAVDAVDENGKITVFAVNRPAGFARPLTSASGRPDVLPWLIGLGVLALGAAIVRHQRQSRLDRRARAQQGDGRLLAALLEAQSKRARNRPA